MRFVCREWGRVPRRRCPPLLPAAAAFHGPPSALHRPHKLPATRRWRPPPPAATVACGAPPPLATCAHARQSHNHPRDQPTNQPINQSIKPAIILLIDPSRKERMNYPIKRSASTADHGEPHYNAHPIYCAYIHMYMYAAVLFFYCLIAYICTHKQYNFSPVRIIADPSRFHIIHKFENGDFILCAIACQLSGRPKPAV